MGSKGWQFMEISHKIKDDPEAGLLLDEFFDACFDSVPLPDWAPVKSDGNPQNHATRISFALAQLNACLKERSILPDGIEPPAGIGLNDWAEELTLRILSNGGH